MLMASAVDWVLLDAAALKVGDVVSADAGGMPTYQVVAMEEGRAWLRDNRHDFVWVLPLSGFHWKAAI
jgi:hypothetical protein